MRVIGFDNKSKSVLEYHSIAANVARLSPRPTPRLNRHRRPRLDEEAQNLVSTFDHNFTCR